jgi:hypothetical protein
MYHPVQLLYANKIIFKKEKEKNPMYLLLKIQQHFEEQKIRTQYMSLRDTVQPITTPAIFLLF